MGVGVDDTFDARVGDTVNPLFGVAPTCVATDNTDVDVKAPVSIGVVDPLEENTLGNNTV